MFGIPVPVESDLKRLNDLFIREIRETIDYASLVIHATPPDGFDHLGHP